MENTYAICSGNKIRMFIVSSDPETIKSNINPGEISVKSVHQGNPSNFMLDDGEIKPLPTQPKNTNLFDFENKVWLNTLSLEELKDSQWGTIKQARNALEFGGFVWDSSWFDSDAISQQRIQGLANIANLDPTMTVQWTLADNTVRVLCSQDAIQVGIALAAHINAQHAKARELRALIESAQTPEQVLAITWDS